MQMTPIDVVPACHSSMMSSTCDTRSSTVKASGSTVGHNSSLLLGSCLEVHVDLDMNFDPEKILGFRFSFRYANGKGYLLN